MKTKYILLLTLISFVSILAGATTYSVDQNYTISVTSGYVNSMFETWNVVSTVTDKPLLISYSIGTESNYDWLTINNVDNSGNITSQLLRICGTQSGTVSTLIPNGRVQIVFTSDGSVCYANNPSIYSGINVTFAVNTNNIVDNTLQVTGNGYVNGNLGVGTINPYSNLDVQGEIKSTLTRVSNFRMTGGAYSSLLRNDGTNTYMLFTNNNDVNGSWNTLRPFMVNNSTGNVNFADSKILFKHSTGNITTTGSIGVGTGNTVPLAKLHVNSGPNNQYASILATSTEDNNLVVSSLNTSTINGEVFRISQEYFNNPSNRNNGYISFFRGDGVNNGFLAFGSNGLERLRINPSGNISIGTTAVDNTQGVLLTVNGTIHAKEVLVDLNAPLADYVFDTNYTLMPLQQVESYVKENKHLPNVPSATEVKDNGMNMGEMQNKLLQKIEELTLYVIEQQKRIEVLEASLNPSKGGK